jgi:hypothetical protein
MLFPKRLSICDVDDMNGYCLAEARSARQKEQSEAPGVPPARQICWKLLTTELSMRHWSALQILATPLSLHQDC